MTNMSIPRYRIFTFFLGFFLLGNYFSTYFHWIFSPVWQVVLIIIILQLAIVFLLKSNRLTTLFFCCSAGLLLGILIFAYSDSQFNTQETAVDYFQNNEIEATIVSQPEISGNQQTFLAKINDNRLSGKIYVTVGQFPKYNYGDKIIISGKIKKPENYSDFDWVNYLRKSGAVAVVENPKIAIKSSGGNFLLKGLYNLKNSINKTINKNLPEPESSLAKGVLIGSKADFSPELMEQFNTVGITHIIALSGFNVTIITAFISSILLGLVSKNLNLLISAVFVGLFVLMTGASASIVRAAIISILLIYGTTIGRKADKTNLLLLAAAIMVALNPYILRYDLGFQLSFLAYCGLIYFAPLIEAKLTNRKLSFLPISIKKIIAETVSAQIFVLPLLLSTFNKFSIIAPITNIIVLPVVPISMFLLLVAVLFYPILTAISKLLFLLSYVPLKYIVLVSKYFAKISYAALEVNRHQQLILFSIYTFLLFLSFILRRKKWRKLALE